MFAAQPAPAATTSGTATSAPKPLTLDQIAALKLGGKCWGEVFEQMKAKGLVTEKNLGQVVKAYEEKVNAAKHEEKEAAHDADKEPADKARAPKDAKGKDAEAQKVSSPQDRRPDAGRDALRSSGTTLGSGHGIGSPGGRGGGRR